jgi:hypothetical protein
VNVSVTPAVSLRVKENVVGARRASERISRHVSVDWLRWLRLGGVVAVEWASRLGG